MYNQEFNCNLVGYYEAVEKIIDLFRPVVTCAVLFFLFCVFFFVLLYTCIPTLCFIIGICALTSTST